MSIYNGVLTALVASVLLVGSVSVGQLISPPLESTNNDPFVHLQCVSPQGQGGYDAKSIEPLGYMMWKATTDDGDVVLLYSDSFSSCLLSKASPKLDAAPAE